MPANGPSAHKNKNFSCIENAQVGPYSQELEMICSGEIKFLRNKKPSGIKT